MLTFFSHDTQTLSSWVKVLHLTHNPPQPPPCEYILSLDKPPPLVLQTNFAFELKSSELHFPRIKQENEK